MTSSKSNKSKLIYYKHELKALTKTMSAKYQCTILTSALWCVVRFPSPIINSLFKLSLRLKLRHTCDRTIRATENFIMLRRCRLFFPPSLLLMSLKCFGVCRLYILSEEEREVIDVIFFTHMCEGFFFLQLEGLGQLKMLILRQRLDNTSFEEKKLYIHLCCD